MPLFENVAWRPSRYFATTALLGSSMTNGTVTTVCWARAASDQQSNRMSDTILIGRNPPECHLWIYLSEKWRRYMKMCQCLVEFIVAIPGGAIQAATIGAAERGVAVPHVVAGDRPDVVRTGPLERKNGVDVLLASAADAQEGDADAFVGAGHLGVAFRDEVRGRRRHVGSGGRMQEVSTIELHEWSSSMESVGNRHFDD